MLRFELDIQRPLSCCWTTSSEAGIPFEPLDGIQKFKMLSLSEVNILSGWRHSMKNGATVTLPTSTGPQTLLEWTGYDVIIETRKVCEADKLLDWVGLRVWTERSFVCFQHFFSLTATPLQVSAVRTTKFGLSVLWEDVKKFSERQKMAARSASVREHTPRQLTGVGRPTSRFCPLQF